jgi:putative ABC transport system permease protein
MTPELSSIEGVGRIQPVREVRIQFRQSPVMLVAVDLVSIQESTRVRAVSGSSEMFRLAAAGKGLIVSENLAELHRLHHGETLELPAPDGLIRLPIVGIIVDYSDQQGSILVDRSVFERHWADDAVNFYRVYLEPGATVPDVKRRILERYAGTRQVFVLNNEEIRTYILGLANQWFGLTYVQIAIAVLVAILGIVNTLTVSITDRRRELGVVRAVGGLKRQVRRTIWIEAMTTAALGVVLGWALGAINLYYVLQMIRQDVAGLRLTYEFPGTLALLVAPVLLGAALVAALLPAEIAVRGSLVEALEYE